MRTSASTWLPEQVKNGQSAPSAIQRANRSTAANRICPSTAPKARGSATTADGAAASAQPQTDTAHGRRCTSHPSRSSQHHEAIWSTSMTGLSAHEALAALLLTAIRLQPYEERAVLWESLSRIFDPVLMSTLRTVSLNASRSTSQPAPSASTTDSTA